MGSANQTLGVEGLGWSQQWGWGGVSNGVESAMMWGRVSNGVESALGWSQHWCGVESEMGWGGVSNG